MLNKVNEMGHYASASVESLMHARTRSAAKIRSAVVLASFFSVTLMVMNDAAHAGNNVNEYVKNVSTRTNLLVDLVNYICYIGGAGLCALGVVGLKKHVENPSQEPLKNPLAKLGIGGMLLLFPFLAGVMSETMKGGQQVTYQSWSNKPQIN